MERSDMENSLSRMRPHLVSEWSEKNFPLTPDTVTFGSNKIVWWKGACGHEWQTSIKARSAGEQCPICSGARVLRGYNDFESKFPELAKEWSPKNEPLRPSMITAATHRNHIYLHTDSEHDVQVLRERFLIWKSRSAPKMSSEY